MSAQPPTNFDVQPVIRDLVGTWRFSSSSAPGQMGLIHFSEASRAVQCLFDPTDPEKGNWMRLWYFIESPTSMRFSYENDSKGWRRSYRLQGGDLVMGGDTGDVVFTRALPNRIPAWFLQSIEPTKKRLV